MEKQRKKSFAEARGNLAYINLRNSLIPEALKLARQKVKKLKTAFEWRDSPHPSGGQYKHCFTTEFFCFFLQKLTVDAMKDGALKD